MSTRPTKASGARPPSTSGSRRARLRIRGSTRRSLTTSTSARLPPPTACAANTQLAPGEPANQGARPLATPAATSRARLQSVPRGVTGGASHGGSAGQVAGGRREVAADPVWSPAAGGRALAVLPVVARARLGHLAVHGRLRPVGQQPAAAALELRAQRG